jgi:two-component system, chemotaxis family, response regulator Rcp1
MIKTSFKTILMVEDNSGDVRLTREAIRNAASAIHLYVATDGLEALAFLKREGEHADAPRPDLILLDLSLPKMDGHEFLFRIKMDDHLKIIPTVVLSSSEAEADVIKSYQLQASCYLTKPGMLDGFENVVKCISYFWLTTATLPPQRSNP